MKRVLIVGGTHGISASLKQLLEKEKTSTVTLARSESADYREDITNLDRELPKIEGTFSGIVYAPGTVNLKPFPQLTIEDFQRDWQINTLGAFRVIQAYKNQLEENSSIVFFSTVAVKIGMSYHASVAASKGAIEGLTRSLAAEFSPKIRVNSIAPSLTDTPLVEMLLHSESIREAMNKRHPLQRVGDVEDVAQMAAFLLSDKASWITGQVIGVDGGMSTLKPV